MMSKSKENWKDQKYQGFEQGPIRPPSEAASLLIRVTRNCPWNHCTFCPVYKRRSFSLRPKEHVIQDIERVADYVDAIRSAAPNPLQPLRSVGRDVFSQVAHEDHAAMNAALHWASGGMESIFIQDANSLIIPADDLIEILEHLRKRFPWTDRITSYARSHTVARIPEEKLKAMNDAGLNRIHIGMESGSDKVLKMVRKGSNKAQHVEAGQKVKAAGMELSEYVMPGLGGRALSEDHALETADALNQIDADFIRFRTLAIRGGIPLRKQVESGEFEKLTDVEVAGEIRQFIASLDGITSRIKSDHILNLFEEIDGQMPAAKRPILDVLDTFLNMTPEEQMFFQVGRRLGMLRRLSDMSGNGVKDRIDAVCRQNGITPDNVEEVIAELMKRFI